MIIHIDRKLVNLVDAGGWSRVNFKTIKLEMSTLIPANPYLKAVLTVRILQVKEAIVP